MILTKSSFSRLCGGSQTTIHPARRAIQQVLSFFFTLIESALDMFLFAIIVTVLLLNSSSPLFSGLLGGFGINTEPSRLPFEHFQTLKCVMFRQILMLTVEYVYGEVKEVLLVLFLQCMQRMI